MKGVNVVAIPSLTVNFEGNLKQFIINLCNYNKNLDYAYEKFCYPFFI